MSAAPAREFMLWGNEPPHSGQWPLWQRRRELWDPEAEASIMLAACGVRWGKDRLTVWTALDCLIDLYIERQGKTNLIPPVLAWVIAPSSGDFDQVFREYVVHTEGLRRTINRSQGAQQIIIEGDPRSPESTGIHIEFKSGWQPDRLVGSGVDLLHITEGAKLADDAWAQAQGRIASPGRAGVLLVNGAPTTAPAAWYRSLFRRGQAGDPAILFVNESSLDNPMMTEANARIFEQMRASVSPRFWRANVLAELLPEGSGLFRGLEEVSTAPEKPGERGARYLKFYDPSGRGDDFDGCTVFRFDGMYRRHPVEVKAHRWQDAHWPRKAERLRAVMTEYPGETHFDANGRISMESELRRIAPPGERIEPHTWTQSAKASMVDHAIRSIENGDVTLLSPKASEAAAVQFGELQDFTETRTRNGVSYAAPEGQHDDMAMCVIPALWALRDVGSGNAREALIRVGAL